MEHRTVTMRRQLRLAEDRVGIVDRLPAMAIVSPTSRSLQHQMNRSLAMLW